MNPEDLTRKVANVTINTNPSWPAGNLVVSLLAGTEMPFDDLLYFVDDQQRGQRGGMTEFETIEIQLPPGPHTVTFSYIYNPIGLDAFPPISVDYIGAAYHDDIHFIPDDGGQLPTMPPVSLGDMTPSPTVSATASAEPTSGSGPTGSVSPVS